MISVLPMLLAAAGVPSKEERPEGEERDAIVVTARRGRERVLPPTSEIGEEELLERQPRSAADAIRAISGVSARVNSRGEAVARLRGSEERQTQVFLDGAPLAVPWDGRADLGIIPPGLIGAVRVTKGAAPIEFGTNAVAGAIDFQTRSGGERDLRIVASAGSLGFGEASAVATLPLGRGDLTLAASGVTRDAEAIASVDVLPFSQPDDERRTNTDLDSATFFAAVRLPTGPLTTRAYLLHLRSNRGIAPESDRDPAIDPPRYWRYPHIEQTQLSLHSTLALGAETSLRLIGWRQWFGQQILQYRDVTYTRLGARQQDEDDTLGGRLVLTRRVKPVTFRLVGTAQTSRHAQVDTQLPSGLEGPLLVYRQNLYTFGAEADAPIGGGGATVGIAYDRSTNPSTADKPGQPGKDAVAFSAAYRLPLGNGFSVTLAGGRRTRFPSSRELFGEALGRFLPNPDLGPERAWLADAELRLGRPNLTLSLNPFFARINGTINQRIVAVNGRRLRQRFNLSGTTSYGLDAALAVRVLPGLDLELGGTLLRARADKGDASFRRLPQRPSYELLSALTYKPSDSLSLRAELRRVGSAVDLGPSGERAFLPPGNEINLRARWGVATFRGGTRLLVTGAVDNFTGDLITPQLGLPLPGRSFRLGLGLELG